VANCGGWFRYRWNVSEPMLAQARQKAVYETYATRQRVRLYQMDMTSFVLGELFRLAIVPFRAFHHLMIPDQQGKILCRRIHLRRASASVGFQHRNRG